VAPSPQGSCPVLIGEHSSPPRKLAAYMRAVQGTVSMGQAAVCWDNAMAESLWATLTTEYCYRRAFTTRDQVYTGVATWIEEICEVMATVPNWAERLPLDADGFECSYYRKD
jgi:integrase catalytic subunit (fragment)